MRRPKDMAPGERHMTNYGEIVITNYISAKNVSVKFIKTGYETSTYACSIRKGTIKDKLLPAVFGVGFIGDGKHKSKVNGIRTEAYACWLRMMNRCYCDAYQERFPTYSGCFVSDYWHDFQNFADWYIENYPNDGGAYHLDKDIKIHGNKEYSENACSFVSPQNNSEKARAKKFIAISPSGEKINGYNLTKFCNEHNLDQSNMSNVAAGRLNHHKGWCIKFLEDHDA